MLHNINSIIVGSEVCDTLSVVQTTRGVVLGMKERMFVVFTSGDGREGEFEKDQTKSNLLAMVLDGLV